MVDEVVDDAVQGVTSVTAPPGRGQWQPLQRLEACPHGLTGGHHVLADSRSDDGHFVAVDINIEQCASDHRQRHLDHFVVQIKVLAVRPTISPIVGNRGKRLAVLEDPLMVEHRLHEPALPAVPLPRAGQQPLAEHQCERLHHRLTGAEPTADDASGEGPAGSDEHVSDDCRVRHEEGRQRSRGDLRDRTVGRTQLGQAREQVGTQHSCSRARATGQARGGSRTHQHGHRWTTTGRATVMADSPRDHGRGQGRSTQQDGQQTDLHDNRDLGTAARDTGHVPRPTSGLPWRWELAPSSHPETCRGCTGVHENY